MNNKELEFVGDYSILCIDGDDIYAIYATAEACKGFSDDACTGHVELQKDFFPLKAREAECIDVFIGTDGKKIFKRNAEQTAYLEKSRKGAEPKRILDEKERFDNEKIYLQRDVFVPVNFDVLAKKNMTGANPLISVRDWKVCMLK